MAKKKGEYGAKHGFQFNGGCSENHEHPKTGKINQTAPARATSALERAQVKLPASEAAVAAELARIALDKKRFRELGGPHRQERRCAPSGFTTSRCELPTCRGAGASAGRAEACMRVVVHTSAVSVHPVAHNLAEGVQPYPDWRSPYGAVLHVCTAACNYSFDLNVPVAVEVVVFSTPVCAIMTAYTADLVFY